MPPSSRAHFDVIVIGAGINGAGIARDAALRGLSVAVIEQTDVCAGTSAWSSRLIHGGLRYLEHAELGLVRESLAERETLLRIAPHLVKPVGMRVPVYLGGRRPLWKIRIGMWLYDVLSRSKSLPDHQILSATELKQLVPCLAVDNLVGGAHYFDAQCVYPERLAVENLLDAADHGATLMLRTRAIKPEIDERVVNGVLVEDATGVQHSISGSVVVNATGAWADAILEDLPLPRLIGGTKGSHLVVDRALDMGDAAIYSEAERDGRPFFIIPWNGMTLIGTTDRRYRGDPGMAAIDDDEFDYLLTETQRVLPGCALTRDDVAYAYCGVRPLPYRDRGAEGSITRRHQIKHHRRLAKGLFSVVGGKLTTYRQLAEEVTDRVCRLLRREVACVTHAQDLPGAGDETDRQALFDAGRGSGLNESQLTQLWRVYGKRSAELLASIREEPALAEELCPQSHTLLVSLVHALKVEWGASLVDILQRRNMAGLGPDFGLCAAETGAPALQRLGVWKPDRAAAELDAYRKLAVRARARGLRPH